MSAIVVQEKVHSIIGQDELDEKERIIYKVYLWQFVYVFLISLDSCLKKGCNHKPSQTYIEISLLWSSLSLFIIKGHEHYYCAAGLVGSYHHVFQPPLEELYLAWVSGQLNLVQ